MKPYYYIRGLRIINKFYNRDKIDFWNIKNNNYYTSIVEAQADLDAIYNKLQKLKKKFGNNLDNKK